jgi:hypothetical protein
VIQSTAVSRQTRVQAAHAGKKENKRAKTGRAATKQRNNSRINPQIFNVHGEEEDGLWPIPQIGG